MSNLKKQGWVRLHRQIEENPLWFSEPFTRAQAWVDLFLGANHKDGQMLIRGNVVYIKRGQIGWSELTMVKRWTWSKNKVRRFLKYLETEQQITQQKHQYITTIITILNYNSFQSDTADDTAEGQQKDSRRYTNKNDKNDKNDKNNYGEAQKVLLSTDEYGKLCDQLSEPIVQTLIVELDQYIASTGKKYLSHYSTIQAWARRRINDHARYLQKKKVNII